MSQKQRVIKLLQGNEACAEAAIAAGARFFGGYPITPSSEIAEELAYLLPKHGGKFIQMEDEIAAMASIIGASLTGVKSITATSGPGYSLKQENIGYAAICEVPCVIVNVQRGGPSTGLPTGPGQSDVMQAMWGTHGDHPAIALAPASVPEIYDMTIRAFNLSEKYRVPVTLLLDEIIGHMRERIDIPFPEELEIVERKKPTVPPEKYLPFENTSDGVPPMANFGEGYRYHVTGLNHDERGYPTNKPEIVAKQEERLLKKITMHLDDIITFEEFMLDDAEIAIFSFGCTARSSRLAIRLARQQGIKVGMFRGITIWPFPEKQIEALAKKVKCIIVAEMNLGQIVYEVERCSRNQCKIARVNRADGEPVTPAQILERIKEVA